MASLDDKGERHLWGPPQSFEVRPLPAAPTVAEPRLEAGMVHLAWLPVAGAERYELELAKTPDFQVAVAQHQSATNQASLPLEPGRYHPRNGS